MKLKYWIAECTTDCVAYSIIGKTKSEVWAKVLTLETGQRYDPPVQRVLEYKDAFDLFDWATGEGGGRNCGSLVK